MAKDLTMFNNSFTKSTKFLSLSGSSKLLYFYLLQDADTDGIVDACMTIRVTNSEITDWTNLIEKNFIWLLKKPYTGFIPDYIIHNPNLDMRWVKDSMYLYLLAEKYPNAIIQRRLKNEKGKYKKALLSVSEYLEMKSRENSQIMEIDTEKKLLSENPSASEKIHENSRELVRTHENSLQSKQKLIQENIIKGNPSEEKIQQHTLLISLGIDAKKADKLLELPHIRTLPTSHIKKIWEYAQKKATANPTGYFIRLLETQDLQLPESASPATYDPHCPKCHGSGKYTVTVDDVFGTTEEVTIPCDCHEKHSKN